MVSKDFSETEKKVSALKVNMMKFDLTAMNKLIKGLKFNPKKLFAVHITGSNGKGSVVAFVSEILVHARMTVGTYVSPQVLGIQERIKINGEKIEEKDFVRLSNKIFLCMKKNKIKASYFEFLTTMAFLHFIEKKVDVAVVEVGMGGRLDATNLLDAKVNVFTSISLEHTQTLGNTIAKIAQEKAGIIKQNSVTVIGKKNAGIETIKGIATKKKSKIIEVEYQTINSSLKENSFALTSPGRLGPYKVGLLGAHQLENAALAVSTIYALSKMGKHIPLNAIQEGLLSAKNPGRLEIVQKKPFVVFDCAHNLGGFLTLKENMSMFEYKKLFLVFAVMDDKDWKKMLAAIKFDHLFASKVKDERALDPKKIKKAFPKARVFTDINSALLEAKKKATKDDLVLVAGSIYAVGEALKGIKNFNNKMK